MAKPEQVLIIEPQSELKFRGPFNVPVTSYMKLFNPMDKRILFKIKTTAPKKYCVRPNSGILDGNNNIEIAICLQPFIYDPTEKNKHKFMVQTVFAPEGEINVDQIWKDISPEQLMDSKLKCVFEVPVEGNATETVGDKVVTAKVTDKTPPSQPTEDIELQKAAAEVKQLREEESSLRQENLQLKEEILRLKQAAGAQVPPSNKYTPPLQAQPIPVSYIAVGIVIALLGLIMGKFIL